MSTPILSRRPRPTRRLPWGLTRREALTLLGGALGIVGYGLAWSVVLGVWR